MTIFFNLALCFEDSSVLCYISIFPPYCQVISHYMDISHFIYPFMMVIWVVSTFWTLWIMLFWVSVYKVLCGHRSLFLLGTYLGVELLDHIVTLCLIVWGTARLFTKGTAPFYIPTSSLWGFHFLHALTNCSYCLFYYSHPS